MKQPQLCDACQLAAERDAASGMLSTPRQCTHGADGIVFAIVEGDGRRVICYQLIGPGLTEEQSSDMAVRYFESIRNGVAWLEQATKLKRGAGKNLN